ncbi:MAG: hypothetical protein JW944_16290 [Deltaproteobacteria bacterium]|nr:hypothetical protein [Deltaproteobacteria bacterium]
MNRTNYGIILSIIFIFILLSSPPAFSGWETGAKAGYDSNIDRAVKGGISDTFMTGFLSFTREPKEDTGTDWSLNLGLEGARYAESTFLNYGMASITPSIIFYPHAKWRVDILSFAQAIAVKDEEQSSVAFGGEISMKQLWGPRYYTGEYFIYTDSKADVEIFSYKDKAVGVYAGVNWTDAFWSEIGYEFSRCDSFRAVEEIINTEIVASQIFISQAGNGGQGNNGNGGTGQEGKGQYGTGNSPRYSEAYNEYIISEPVNRQIAGINTGYQFTRHVFSFINYAYVSYKGDAGDSVSHTGVIGVGYTF